MRLCLIKTSIGMNFKYIELDNIKKEENTTNKRAHINNLKLTLNEIAKSDMQFPFKGNTDLFQGGN